MILEVKRKYEESLRNAEKHSQFFKRLYKPYQKVPGYANLSKIAAQLALVLESAEIAPTDDWVQDISWTTAIIAGHEMLHSPTPVYILDHNLGEAFLRTELPDVTQLQKVIHHGIILIPPGLLVCPDGVNIHWLYIRQLEAGKPTPPYVIGGRRICSYPPEADKINWGSITFDRGACYSSTVEILSDKPEPVTGPISIVTAQTTKPTHPNLEQGFLTLSRLETGRFYPARARYILSKQF